MPQRQPRLARLCLLLALAVAWQGCRAGSSGGDPGYSSDECSDACNKVAAPNCGDVDSSCFGSCVSFPNAQYEGDCQPELRSYFDCWWKAASYQCDAESHTQPVGCDEKLSTYRACSEGAGAGGAGAGGANGASGSDDGSAGATEPAAAGSGGASAGGAGAGDGTDTGGVAGAAG